MGSNCHFRKWFRNPREDESKTQQRLERFIPETKPKSPSHLLPSRLPRLNGPLSHHGAPRRAPLLHPALADLAPTRRSTPALAIGRPTGTDHAGKRVYLALRRDGVVLSHQSGDVLAVSVQRV